MAVSALGNTVAAYYANTAGNASQEASRQSTTAPAVLPSPSNSESTVVTLSNGQTVSVIAADPGTLKATPLEVAWAPQMFVQGDTNQDQQLSSDELAGMLKRIDMSAKAAQDLFKSLVKPGRDGLSMEDFVDGVKAYGAQGDDLFKRLMNSFTSDASGQTDLQTMQAFLRKGLAAAQAYWSQHQ